MSKFSRQSFSGSPLIRLYRSWCWQWPLLICCGSDIGRGRSSMNKCFPLLCFYLSTCHSLVRLCVRMCVRVCVMMRMKHRRGDTWALWQSRVFVWHHSVSLWFQSAHPPPSMTPDRLMTDKECVCVSVCVCVCPCVCVCVCLVGAHRKAAIRRLSN